MIQRDLTCQIRTSRIISTEVFLPRRQINRNLPKAIWKIKLENVLAANDLIDSAKVTLDIPDDDGTLISRMQESSASVSLALNGSMDSDQAVIPVASPCGNRPWK